MWIQTQNGNLVNCDEMHAITLDTDNKSVVGVVGNNHPFLIGSFNSTPEAKQQIQAIFNAISRNASHLIV